MRISKPCSVVPETNKALSTKAGVCAGSLSARNYKEDWSFANSVTCVGAL